MANGSYVVRQSENLPRGYVVTCVSDGVISNIQVRGGRMPMRGVVQRHP